jgi:hypothetical protein
MTIALENSKYEAHVPSWHHAPAEIKGDFSFTT